LSGVKRDLRIFWFVHLLAIEDFQFVDVSVR